MKEANMIADDFLQAKEATYTSTRTMHDVTPHERTFKVVRNARPGFDASLKREDQYVNEFLADIRLPTEAKGGALVFRDNMFYQAPCECEYGHQFADLLVRKLGIGCFADEGGEIVFISKNKKFLHEEGSVILNFMTGKLLSVKLDYDAY